MSDQETDRHSHLTSERAQRRRKPAGILKREDLDEEKLHEYFIEHLKTTHALYPVKLNWSVVSTFPKIKSGKVCDHEFIDGILFPESIGEGRVPHVFKSLQPEFMDCGLVLRKMDPKKAQSYYNKKQVLHRPYFAKLDDRGFRFDVKRITSL